MLLVLAVFGSQVRPQVKIGTADGAPKKEGAKFASIHLVFSALQLVSTAALLWPQRQPMLTSVSTEH